MQALKDMDIIKSKVIRDGKTIEIPSENLTLGDVAVLEAGDLIPSDGRLVETNQLQCDESSLTGESILTEKNIENLPKNTALADQHNMVFKGSSVMNGNVVFITLAFAQLFHVFNMSSVKSYLFINDITKNKFVWFAIVICTGLMVLVYILPQMRLVLGLVELSTKIWIVSILASLIPLVVV
jgi:P-type Ca2+ transporter type 2C